MSGRPMEAGAFGCDGAAPGAVMCSAFLRDYQAELDYVARIQGASIYLAVQNIVLACRALGLGTVITTNHLRCEAEVKALFGLPAEVETCALMPIGYPLDPVGPLSRRPLAEVAHADHWSVPWPY